jgi:ABC-type nitrate/sulfonate/bicarbonate transport system substrate-binding protein
MDFPCGNKWELHYSGSAIKKQEGGLPDLRIVNSTIGRHDVPTAAGRSLGAAVGACNDPGRMKNFSAPLPLWARAGLLAGLVGVALGASLVAYRYYSKPETLNLAVGSFDGEAAKIAAIIAGRLDAAKSALRVKVVPTGSVLDSAKLFAAGKTDLAIVRADVGDLSQARSVALVNKSVLMILALPGSMLTRIEKLKGHTVGVVGGEINQKIVDALKKEYDLADKVTFKSIAPADVPRAIQSKEASAFLVVVPLNE